MPNMWNADREREALEAAERSVLMKHGLLSDRKDPRCMTQAEMKKEYERQQTPEGKKALAIKRELSKEFAQITGKKPREIGAIQPMKNGRTGLIDRYYIAE